MAGAEAGAGDGAGAHHPRLKLGDFGKRGVDAVLDCADLGGDFVGGVFDHLFAHDCSFSGAACAPELAVGSEVWRGSASR